MIGHSDCVYVRTPFDGQGDDMINPMDLSKQLILVTGASSGIGSETAVVLSQLGARVILVGRNAERLERTRERMDGEGHLVFARDLMLVDDIPVWMNEAAGLAGPLSGLVHCAGVQFTRPIRATTTANVEELMRINVTAAVSLAKAFRQKGMCAENGSIVFLSSVMGIVGESGQAAYSASKGALIALTKSLALELSRQKIRVNCVAPAIVKTEMSDRMMQAMAPEQVAQVEAMHPLGLGQPRDVAQLIAFLLGETGRWITGTTITIDGGYTAH